MKKDRIFRCQDCWHVFEATRVTVWAKEHIPCCPFCSSFKALMAGPPLKHEKNYSLPQLAQPDLYQQINYAVQFRLMKGFAIMHAGESDDNLLQL